MQERIAAARARARDLLRPTKAQIEHGLRLHRESLVVDAFGFAPYASTRKMVESLNEWNDQGATNAELQAKQLEMRVMEPTRDAEAREQYVTVWRAAGVTGAMQNLGGQGPLYRSLHHFARFFRVWDCMPEVSRRAICAEDVITAKAENRHCQFISLNALPGQHHLGDLDGALAMIETIHNLGCRMMHLPYNRRNLIGDGCIERANGGLSEFGREVVERMNRVGIIVDTAHSGAQTTCDAAHASEAPMAASHTGCAAVHAHDRCKSDDAIRAIAETGGFVGVCCIPEFLGGRGTIVELLDHVDYVVKLVGAEHAAIGTDVGTVAPDPEGIELKPFPKTRAKNRNWRPEHLASSEQANEEHRSGSLCWMNWPYFTVGLVQRGHSDDDVRKIIGGNVLRVLREVAGRAGCG